ncbi:4-hydroxy-tetrahydrodipicolinate reductase [bacterium]|nr:4-hydroxy-tetrahydrodipicolinate reductase [bacterium]MBU1881754.1 4-hydroxy-tetrahydrodipicolinate reductase [bacterium]
MASSQVKSTKTSTISIGLCGAAGRMGREIFRSVALSSDIHIVKAYETEEHRFLGAKLGDAVFEADTVDSFLEDCQVFVDFSAPPQRVLDHLKIAAERKVGAIVGSTGIDDKTRDAMQKFAQKIPLLYAANMSLGVNVLMALAQKTQEILGGGFDVDIIETHHRGKQDAPSGTSLMIEQQLRLVDKEVEVRHHSVRAGDVVGEHTVQFTGIGERLELIHRATSREAFTKGTMAAIRFIARQQPGFYDMRRVLGI